MKQYSLIEKAFFLKKNVLFSALDLDLLVAIADKMNQDIYDKNETVFAINQRAGRMFLIAKGSVVLLSRDNQPIADLNEQDFFGDESLFNSEPRSYQALCSENSLFLTITKPNIMSIISECPSVAIALLQHYAKTSSCRLKKMEIL